MLAWLAPPIILSQETMVSIQEFMYVLYVCMFECMCSGINVGMMINVLTNLIYSITCGA